MSSKIRGFKPSLARAQWSKPIKVYAPSGGTSNGAKQSFKDQCDINKIMAKYQKTGAIDHLNKHGANYGFATAIDFHESMNLVTSAQQMFDDLPSDIRTKFYNSPAQFLDFVQNPENADQLVELGLATAAPAAPVGSGERDAPQVGVNPTNLQTPVTQAPASSDATTGAIAAPPAAP